MMEDMMWADFCKRWLDLCCWWLPTTAGEEKNGAEAKPSPTMTKDLSTDQTTVGSEDDTGSGKDDADDLTVIKGIGPSIETKLRGFGITSFAVLAASDPETLAAKLKASQPISTTRVKSWIEAARERASGRS
jgi:predicted flap endonuclease-1-like 5' DNA nuclease